VSRFTSFVVVAEMRSGSNLLESCLNALDGISCHGELFNGAFIGSPGRHEAFGIDETTRESNPATLLRAMAASGPGLHGFRYFHDHDPRIADLVVGDPGCAIVLLSRNPVEAYVSRKIAQATGQWRLGDLADRRGAKVHFDPVEFTEYLGVRDRFRRGFRRSLQTAGRTPFSLRYEELGDLDILNGLAAWLGAGTRLSALPGRERKQNPGPLSSHVENHDEMAETLGRLGFAEVEAGRFRRPPGPGVPEYVLPAKSAVMFQPIAGGPTARILRWLEGIDGAAPITGLRQKDLREWLATRSGHRSFTVLRHPVLRAYANLRSLGREGLPEGLVAALGRYGVVPDPDPPTREAFAAWLTFLAGAVEGQTSVRVHRRWRLQADLVSGFSVFRPPDLILREADLEAALPGLVAGSTVPPDPDVREMAAELSVLVTPRIEDLARRAYSRDYLTFGFGNWASGSL